ncbi:hypothetical protein [Gordonia effusa]|uniref:hypothetical protein n=1 Tax=Gordonia effusa TaxID=263908 RepID=UPI00031089E2|nr:hypothetical protein [Gordonia effusa]
MSATHRPRTPLPIPLGRFKTSTALLIIAVLIAGASASLIITNLEDHTAHAVWHSIQRVIDLSTIGGTQPSR